MIESTFAAFQNLNKALSMTTIYRYLTKSLELFRPFIKIKILWIGMEKSTSKHLRRKFPFYLSEIFFWRNLATKIFQT